MDNDNDGEIPSSPEEIEEETPDVAVSEASSTADDKEDLKIEEAPDRCGVIYLSRIPTRMNVKLVREYFEQFGSVGRIYLQPADEAKSGGVSKKRRSQFRREFTEGWLEYSERRIARKVAQSLNNETVGGRRRHPWHDEIWNIKYLKGFKWAHLNERMAYEKAVKAKRLRLEVGQAKKEAQFFSEHLEFSKRIERSKHKKEGNEEKDNNDNGEKKIGEDGTAKAKTNRRWQFNQNKPQEDMKRTAKKKQKTNQLKGAAAESKQFLANIFTAGQQ